MDLPLNFTKGSSVPHGRVVIDRLRVDAALTAMDTGHTVLLLDRFM